jgi:hypothetical protein
VAASGARPIITYAVAAIGANQAYIHFSDYVYGNNTASASIAAANFTYSGGAITALQPLETSGIGAHAALITFATALLYSDILTGAQTVTASALGVWSKPYPAQFVYPSSTSPGNPINPPYANLNADGNNYLSPNAPAMLTTINHRISDIGLGFVVPVIATDQNLNGASVGSISTFDGSEWLLLDNVQLEARIMIPALAADTVTLAWDVTPPPSTIFNNIWIAPSASTLWPTSAGGDLVHFPGDAQSRAVPATGINGALRDFIIPSTDPAIKDGAVVQFMFLLNDGAGNILPCVFSGNPNAGAASEFEYAIHALKVQRGGVTITNNVIRPDNGQTAFLNYTVSTPGPVTILVFDLSGSIINVLQRGSQSPGQYAVPWDGKNRGGRAVARGIYFIRAVGPGFDEIRKVLVVR